MQTGLCASYTQYLCHTRTHVDWSMWILYSIFMSHTDTRRPLHVQSTGIELQTSHKRTHPCRKKRMLFGYQVGKQLFPRGQEIILPPTRVLYVNFQPVNGRSNCICDLIGHMGNILPVTQKLFRCRFWQINQSASKDLKIALSVRTIGMHFFSFPERQFIP